MVGPMEMMMMLKVMGLVAFIITILLLAVSFFIMVAVRKAEGQGLKVFGYVVAILLWVCAAIVFSGVISATTMRCGLKSPMMRGMHGMKAGGMQKNMQMPNAPDQGQNHAMPTEKPAAAKPAQ